MKTASIFSNKLKFPVFISLVLSFLVGLYLTADINFLSGQIKELPTYLFFVILGVFAILVFGLFFLNQKSEKPIKQNFVLGVSLSLLVIANVVATLIFKAHTDFSLIGVDGETYAGSYDVEIVDKIKYIIKFAIVCFIVYQIFVFFPQMGKDQRIAIMFAYIVITIVAIITIISYATEYQKYYDFVYHFKNHGSYNFVLTPLGLHKNTYGFLLTLQIFCMLFLFSRKHQWYWIGIIAFVYINLIFTLCKAGLILSLVAVIAYLLYLLVISWKNNIKRSIIIVSIIGGIIAVGLILLLLSYVLPGSFLEKVRNDIYMLFNVGQNTIYTRSLIWKNCFAILQSCGGYFIGCGFGVFGGLLKQYNLADPNVSWFNDTAQAHNAWIEYLCNGGALQVIIVLAILVMFIKVCIKTFKKDRNLTIFTFILLICGLLYGLFENYPLLLAPTAESIAMTFLLFVPMMSKYYSLEQEERKCELVERDSLAVFMLFLSPILGLAFISPIFYLILTNGNMLWLIAISALAALTFVFFPVIYLYVKKAEHPWKKYASEYLFNSIIMFFISMALMGLTLAIVGGVNALSILFGFVLSYIVVIVVFAIDKLAKKNRVVCALTRFENEF